MKLTKIALVLLGSLCTLTVARAQEAAKEGPVNTTPVANPVSSTVKEQLTRSSKNIVTAAEAMPADKYSFKPTPEMGTFGHLIMHIAGANTALCSKASGMAVPEMPKLAETDPKDKLVAGLKASFEFCSTALATVDDSKLSDPMTLFGSMPSSRAGALIILSGSWSDHYGSEAMYLRLNKILPPTAKAKE